MARFVGTARNDTITPATISAGVVIIPAGADLSGDDRILSRSGNDRVEGDSGDDVAFLGNGKDRFIWNPGDGDDTFNGGSGTDTLEFNGSDDAELMTVTTLDNGGFRFFRDLGDITVDTRFVERVEVNALGGNDTIDGSAQTRSNVELVVNAGDGNDRIIGGAGDDQIEGAFGNDVAFGLSGNDSFAWDPGDGDDTFTGGSGTDTLAFDGSDDAELMTVTTLDNGGFRFFRDLGDITVDTRLVERVEVNALGGNDTIDGSAQTRSNVELVVNAGDGNDRIIGGAGDDQIEGAFGNDVAFGLSGNDSFAWDPGDGDDTFTGGSGTDTLAFDGSDDAELMTVTTLDNGGFRFFRDLGDITVDTRRVERVEVNALGGNDTIDGSAQTRSNVELEIEGGTGRDHLTGGAGDDFLSGQAGVDTFIFQPGAGDDQVLDFTDDNGAQDDRIDVSAYGFTNVGQIGTSVSGDDLVLNLGGGDSVRLVDYLTDHVVSDLQNNDFIF